MKMHMKLTTSTITALLLAACASGGPGNEPAVQMAYQVPSPPMATYVIGDTGVVAVEVPGMGNQSMTNHVSLTLDLTFERTASGIQANGEVVSYSGSANTMMGTTTANMDDLEGVFQVLLDRHGVQEVVTVPTIPGDGPNTSLGDFSYLPHNLLIRLPESEWRGDEPGPSWTDPVLWSTEVGPASTSSETIYTYTVVGDTVIDGSTLLAVTVAGVTETEIVLNQMGMEIELSLSGDVSGSAFFDPGLGLLHSSDLEFSQTGSTSMAAMGMSAPTTNTRKLTIRRQS